MKNIYINFSSLFSVCMYSYVNTKSEVPSTYINQQLLRSLAEFVCNYEYIRRNNYLPNIILF